MIGWFALASAASTGVQYGDGLRLVLDPIPLAPTVTVATIVGAGHVDDPPGAEGTAHVVEHLWFDTPVGGGLGVAEGTRTFAALFALGCTPAGFTFAGEATYATACPPERLPLLVERELARVRDPLAAITDDDVARAFAVVSHEEAGRDDDVASVVLPRLYGALYPPEHPVVARDSRPRLGVVELASLRAWAADHLGPASVTVAVTGRFDPSEVRRAFDAEHGAPTGTFLPMQRRAAPPPRRTLRPAPRRIELPIAHPIVALGWAPPGFVSGLEGAVTADLVAEALGRIADARIVGVGCASRADAFGHPLMCLVATADEAALDGVAAEIRAVTDELWVGEERKRAITRYAAALGRAEVGFRGIRDDRSPLPGGWATVLASFAHWAGSVDPIGDASATEWPRARAFVDRARERLDPAEAAILIAVPDRTPVALSEGPSPPPGAPAVVAAVPAGSAAPLDVAERTTDAGVRILAISRPDAEFVHAMGRLAAGPDPRVLLALEASTYRERIDEVPDVLGAATDSPFGRIAAVRGDPRALSAILDALDAQLRPAVQAAPWLQYVRARAAVAHTLRATEATHWARVLPIAAVDPTGWAAYGASGRGFTLAVTAGDVVTGFAEVARPDHAEVVVVGPGGADALADAAVRAVAAPWSTPNADPPAPASPASPWTGPRTLVIDDPSSDGAVLTAACAVPSAPRPVSEVAIELVRQHLWVRLRERDSLVYTPSVERSGDVVAILADTGWATAGQVRDGIDQELAIIEAGAPDPLLPTARAQVGARSPARGSPQDALQQAFGERTIATADEVRAFDGAVAAVDEAAVARALAGCRAGLVIAVAGPGPAIAERLGGDVDVVTPAEARDWVIARVP